MFFRVKSSRDTSAGMFRAGIVYGVHDKDYRVLNAIKPHLVKGGAFEKLNAKAAEKAQADAVMLMAPGEVLAEDAAADKAGK